MVVTEAVQSVTRVFRPWHTCGVECGVLVLSPRLSASVPSDSVTALNINTVTVLCNWLYFVMTTILRYLHVMEAAKIFVAFGKIFAYI